MPGFLPIPARRQLGIVDPGCRMLGLHLYEQMLKIIPVGQRGTVKEAFNVRLEELQVRSAISCPSLAYGRILPWRCSTLRVCRHAGFGPEVSVRYSSRGAALSRCALPGEKGLRALRCPCPLNASSPRSTEPGADQGR